MSKTIGTKTEYKNHIPLFPLNRQPINNSFIAEYTKTKVYQYLFLFTFIETPSIP